MRFFLRGVFTFALTILSHLGVQMVFLLPDKTSDFRWVYPAILAIIVQSIGVLMRKWDIRILVASFLIALSIMGGVVFGFWVKIIFFAGCWVFWYAISTLIFRLSRDEKLRLTETPSQTALRRVQEKRTEEMKEIEREHFERMLDSMPESERIALLKKQKEYEEHLNKKGR